MKYDRVLSWWKPGVVCAHQLLYSHKDGEDTEKEKEDTDQPESQQKANRKTKSSREELALHVCYKVTTFYSIVWEVVRLRRENTFAYWRWKSTSIGIIRVDWWRIVSDKERIL